MLVSLAYHMVPAGLFLTDLLEQLDNLLKKVRDRALKELGVEPEPLPKAFDTARFLSNVEG